MRSQGRSAIRLDWRARERMVGPHWHLAITVFGL